MKVVSEEKKEINYVSRIEFAKILGISPGAISSAIKTNRLKNSIIVDDAGRIRIDPRAGVIEFQANKKRGATVFSKAPERAKSDDSDVSDSERRLKLYKAELAKLDLEQQQGKLIQSDKVRKQAFKVARSVRDAMLNIPDRLSAELAAETDAFQVHKKLTDEIAIALDNLVFNILEADEPDEFAEDQGIEHGSENFGSENNGEL